MHRMCHIINTCLAVCAVSLGATVKVDAAPTIHDRQVQIVTDEMCCKGCAQKVSGQLYGARGVKSVEVDMKTRTVSICLAPRQSATLGQLWHAVEQGEGGPTKLFTAEATYSLTPPEIHAQPGQPAQGVNWETQIVIENLHCMGCAKKIGEQLYALKGVTGAKS